jgi:Flp pilus assembly protein TadG
VAAQCCHPGRPVRSDEGSSVVEAVIVVPILMFVLLVIVQFCLWMHATQVAQLAASEGDRVARSYGGGPAAGAASAQAVLHGPGSDVTGSSVTAAVLSGDSEVLMVTGRATSVVPGLSFTVSASAIGPIQQFRGSE